MSPSTIGIIFALVGIVLLAIGVTVFMRTRKFLATAVGAQGTVIAMVERERRDSKTKEIHRTWSPQVRFAVGEKTYDFTSSVSSSPPRYQEGQTIDVKYDPQDPNNAKVASGSSYWTGPIILGGLGVIFTIVGLAMAIAG
jgi:type II secretory pathway pseudopilin PulG